MRYIVLKHGMKIPVYFVHSTVSTAVLYVKLVAYIIEIPPSSLASPDFFK
jgi:hypothetical protein